MKKALFITAILLAALTVPAMAVVGKTPVAFTDSEYAKALDLKVNMQKPDLLAYVGSGKELVVLKTKKEVVWYERLTWLSKSMPQDPEVIRKAYIAFVSQAVEIAAGTPEYEQLSQTLQAADAEFMLKNRFVIRIKNEEANGATKHYIEVFEKSQN
jgi:hypothetical protein